MRMLLLAAALTAGAALAGPASAQFYDGPGYDRRPPPDYGYGPRRHRDWDEDGYDRPRPRYDRRLGHVCVTARGSCPTPGPLPRGASCGCHIPGFGPKRGGVE